MSSYEDRLNLPLVGATDIEFFTLSGTLVARGYERIVIGQRGPYIEFSEMSIVREAIVMPSDQEWRLGTGYVYYNEWRSADESSVKLYEQRKTVDYADYRVGMWYLSPFDLTTKEYAQLVKPSNRRRKQQNDDGEIHRSGS
jgi:hypothetical protein